MTERTAYPPDDCEPISLLEAYFRMTERAAYKFRYDPDTDPSRTGAAWQASGLSRNNPRPVTALKRG